MQILTVKQRLSSFFEFTGRNVRDDAYRAGHVSVYAIIKLANIFSQHGNIQLGADPAGPRAASASLRQMELPVTERIGYLLVRVPPWKHPCGTRDQEEKTKENLTLSPMMTTMTVERRKINELVLQYQNGQRQK